MSEENLPCEEIGTSEPSNGNGNGETAQHSPTVEKDEDDDKVSYYFRSLELICVFVMLVLKSMKSWNHMKFKSMGRCTKSYLHFCILVDLQFSIVETSSRWIHMQARPTIAIPIARKTSLNNGFI